jgi:predicted ATP-grasp superfamily ATP-dependent carboligase
MAWGASVYRIFIYEYTSASPGVLPQSMRSEGRAMLEAVLADFACLPHVQTLTLPQLLGDEESAFRALARAADFTLVIAPETDDILYRRCRWVEECGGQLLGPSPEAVRLSGDKLACGRRLRTQGVPTPPCYLAAPGIPIPMLRYPAVWKPRHGAGSQAIFRVETALELERCAERARQEGWAGESVVQPFVPGMAASVAFLLGPQQQVALAPTAQHLSADGRFCYHGGTLPLPHSLAQRAVRLGNQAVAVIPDAKGYVGVDLVLGEPMDGSRDEVIEINPRLTTSYIGLRALARGNLAEAMLRTALGQEIPHLHWRTESISFSV